jgi:hypothetical protein
MPTSVSSLILLLAGAGFVGFGVAYVLRPDRMAALTDLSLPSPTARADFLATYGGFQIGFGLFLLACAMDAQWLEPGLWATVAALGGFATVRLMTLVAHRARVRSTIWVGLALEVSGVALGILGLVLEHPG